MVDEDTQACTVSTFDPLGMQLRVVWGHFCASTSLCPMILAAMAMLWRDLRNHEPADDRGNRIILRSSRNGRWYALTLPEPNTLGLDHGRNIWFRGLYHSLHDVVLACAQK
jgi:hypothetical protein